MAIFHSHVSHYQRVNMGILGELSGAFTFGRKVNGQATGTDENWRYLPEKEAYGSGNIPHKTMA